jgi:alpha-1,3/alpha-1,6-mannosyltransferase
MTKSEPDVLFLLNFTTPQRTYLLRNSNTVAMLYTPTNEHFGIGPVEGMICGVPVLACNSGGPVESVVDPSQNTSYSEDSRTGWLRSPDEDLWAEALAQIVSLSPSDRAALGERAKRRARDMFGMEAMAESLEGAIVDAVSMGPVRSQGVFLLWIGLFGFLIAYFVASWVM